MSVASDRDASHSPPERELDRTAVEVAEFVAHLFEREPDGKEALRGVDRRTERQTLVAKRGDHPRRIRRSDFGCLGFAPGGQRVCASAQVIGCAFRDAQDQRSQSPLEHLAKRLGSGPPEHDEVVTKPEQRPPQRSQVWLGGEKADPLVLRFVGDRMCLRDDLQAPRNDLQKIDKDNEDLDLPPSQNDIIGAGQVHSEEENLTNTKTR
jgi:hypothetical protein